MKFAALLLSAVAGVSVLAGCTDHDDHRHSRGDWDDRRIERAGWRDHDGWDRDHHDENVRRDHDNWRHD